MSATTPTAVQRVYLGNISWSTYVALANSADNPRGRMAYDQGILEIMSPSSVHEYAKKLIGRFIEVFTLERGIDIRSASSTTLQRADLEKGVEADECYYVQSVDAITGVDDIDLSVHPPPDLAIEVDITRTSKIKLGIYAALGIAELWRFDGLTLAVLTLQNDGYRDAVESRVLPGFPLEDARRLLSQRTASSETALVRQFQLLIRTQP